MVVDTVVRDILPALSLRTFARVKEGANAGEALESTIILMKNKSTINCPQPGSVSRGVESARLDDRRVQAVRQCGIAAQNLQWCTLYAIARRMRSPARGDSAPHRNRVGPSRHWDGCAAVPHPVCVHLLSLWPPGHHQ